ncbi:MAG: hypothetical protein WC382_13620 [Methanoregulaceae archaeon]
MPDEDFLAEPMTEPPLISRTGPGSFEDECHIGQLHEEAPVVEV